MAKVKKTAPKTRPPVVRVATTGHQTWTVAPVMERVKVMGPSGKLRLQWREKGAK